MPPDVISAEELLEALQSFIDEKRTPTLPQLCWRIERLRGWQPAPTGLAVAEKMIVLMLELLYEAKDSTAN